LFLAALDLAAIRPIYDPIPRGFRLR
jgi:hypothetical protein